MRPISDTERRARLARRHLVAPTDRAVDALAATDAVVALHGTDASTVYLSLWARVPAIDIATIDRALYDDRSLVRMLAMRRTVFVVSREALPVVPAAATTGLLAGERKKVVDLAAALGKSDRWLRALESKTLAAVEARGEALASELGVDVPDLRLTVTTGVGTKWEGTQSLSTRVLWLLANDARIVRARPRGSWLSSQHRWAPMDRWLGGPLSAIDPSVARIELVRRWLGAFGPGTAIDLRWWTGWTAKHVHAALTELGAVEVGLDSGATGWVLAGDERPAPEAKPWVALLPALDPTAMGWKERDWYVGAHAPALFDRSGNIGPTVWSNGRIVGGWAQRASGEVVTRLLEDIGAAQARKVDARAAALAQWLGAARVTPRFRTPLERELSA
ncbi:MAG: hypothetical protein QOE63_770 [Acidimicrobiaceae bacterium]